jgi:hypothetical protein
MRAGRIASRPVALAVLIGVIMLAAGCGSDNYSYPEVSVTTPELSTAGPAMTVFKWRHGVVAICRRAAVEVGGATKQLTREIDASDEIRDEGEVSQQAFALGRPVFERQLRALAQLQPPARLADDYQGFISDLAKELLWTGRIAAMLGTDASDEALQEADSGLADSAAGASAFARENGLSGCMLEHGNRG